MRKTKRRHRGGDNFSTTNTYSYPSSNTYSSTSNSGLDSALNFVKNGFDSVKKGFDSAKNSFSNTYYSASQSFSNSNPTPTYENPNEKPWWKFWGGKSRRRRNIRAKALKKGGSPVGYPDLSLATDVNGIKVVEPTYWIKGGMRSKSRSKSRSSRRYRKK